MQVLSETLDAQLLIEGVEELEQLECLQELGCHLYQGYYFSRPLFAHQVKAFLDSTMDEVDPLSFGGLSLATSA